MDWYSVRCIIRFPPDVYEERVTLWRTTSLGAAIEVAEAEVGEYIDGLHGEYVGLAQAYALTDAPQHGGEVFSLMRTSELPPTAYIDRFFDTGYERQQGGTSGQRS